MFRGKLGSPLKLSSFVVVGLAASFIFATAPASFADPFTVQLQNNFALEFAVLGQFSANQSNFNNGTITGADVGMGSPRQFTMSNASLFGNVRFSGATSTSGFAAGACPNVSGGGCFSGSITGNDPQVAQAITFTNSLSQTLGGEAGSGTSITVTPGGSINASAGFLDPNGNRIFNVTSVNFPNGTFTINGSSSDYVVLDVGSTSNFHGQIVLAGGITSDQVLINLFGGNYATHMGGPTLDVNTNGLITSGIFLDPNGGMSAVNTTLAGRFFGGDVQNQQIVSGANINSPGNFPPQGNPIPEPSSLSLLGSGLVGLGVWRRKGAK